MDHIKLIQQVDHVVVILDVDKGCFVEFNDKALSFFKLSRKELLARDPFSLSPAHIYGHESKQYSQKVIGEALAGENPVFDWIHIDKSGTEIPCEVRLIRVPPYSKKLVRGTILDKRLAEPRDAILRESEERLRISIESSNQGTFDWYPQEDRLYWDTKLYEIFELDPEVSIDLNEHFFSVLHPEDVEQVRAEFANVLKQGDLSFNRIEYRVVLNDKVKYILAHSKIIRNEQGEVIRMLGTSQDVTLLRESQEKLQQNEELLKKVVEDQQEMILRWKPGGYRTFVNQAYCKAFALSEDEAIGKSFFPLLEEDFRKEFEKGIAQLTPENPVRSSETQRILPNGKKVWQEWTERAYFDEAGQPIEYQSVGRDITEMIEAQKLVADREERYRNVFNQQFQFTALLDLDGKVVYINDLPLKAQNLTREDYIGKFFWDSPAWVGNPEWQRKIKAQVMFAKKTGVSNTVEDPFMTADGEGCAKASYSVIKNSEGQTENILVQAIDITGEKRAQQAVKERERKLSLIYSNTTDFILLLRCDKDDYIIEDMNDNFMQLVQYFDLKETKEEVIGMSMHVMYQKINLPQETASARMQMFDQIKKKREPVSYEQATEKEKGLLATHVDVVPVSQEDAVTHILMVAKDITESYLGKRNLEEAYLEVQTLKAQLEQENTYLKEEIRQANDFENMVFASSEFRIVLNKVEQVAKTDATVLITGETGTGKELIARAIHNTSIRAEKPMIKVNTGAIPKDLIESELFGYDKGAFTGATGEKPGKFELADGGSIFLDEIGDMPMDLQVKILRVLQEGEVERLGSTELKKIDVRIISATNKNLEKAVEAGTFREDLYFRLKVFPIHIPPLRSRLDDIPLLVEHFMIKYAAKHDKQVTSIPKNVMNYLRNYAWPGNVRELENTVERAIILSTGNRLELQEVPDDDSPHDQWEDSHSLEVIQENHIRKILIESEWRVEGKDGAAAKLKIKPSTLRDKIKKFHIKRPD